MSAKDLKDRRLLAMFAAGGAAAAGLMLAPSNGVLPGALGIGASLAALSSWWIYRDAAARKQNAAGWAVVALLFWPMTMPMYLILTRGLRGLLLSAAVLFVFFLLPFSFVITVFRETRASRKLVEEGWELYWDQSPGDPNAGRKKALALFEKAVRSNPRDWNAYSMVYVAAFGLGRPRPADEHYARMEKDRDGGRAGPGWFLAAFTYHDQAIRYYFKEAADELIRGNIRRIVFAAGSATRHDFQYRDIDKDWRRFLSALSGKERRLYKKELRAVEQVRGNFKLHRWRLEKTNSLGVKLAADKSWREAFESYGGGLRAAAAGEDEEAGRLMNRAAKLIGNFSSPLVSLARLRLSKGRRRAASAAARRAVDRLRKSEPILFDAKREEMLATAFAVDATALYEEGRTAEAKKKLARALRLNAKCETAQMLQLRMTRKP